jgi:hypothetical protein
MYLSRRIESNCVASIKTYLEPRRLPAISGLLPTSTFVVADLTIVTSRYSKLSTAVCALQVLLCDIGVCLVEPQKWIEFRRKIIEEGSMQTIRKQLETLKTRWLDDINAGCLGAVMKACLSKERQVWD